MPTGISPHKWIRRTLNKTSPNASQQRRSTSNAVGLSIAQKFAHAGPEKKPSRSHKIIRQTVTDIVKAAPYLAAFNGHPAAQYPGAMPLWDKHLGISMLGWLGGALAAGNSTRRARLASKKAEARFEKDRRKRDRNYRIDMAAIEADGKRRLAQLETLSEPVQQLRKDARQFKDEVRKFSQGFSEIGTKPQEEREKIIATGRELRERREALMERQEEINKEYRSLGFDLPEIKEVEGYHRDPSDTTPSSMRALARKEAHLRHLKGLDWQLDSQQSAALMGQLTETVQGLGQYAQGVVSNVCQAVDNVQHFMETGTLPPGRPTHRLRDLAQMQSDADAKARKKVGDIEKQRKLVHIGTQRLKAQIARSTLPETIGKSLESELERIAGLQDTNNVSSFVPAIVVRKGLNLPISANSDVVIDAWKALIASKRRIPLQKS